VEDPDDTELAFSLLQKTTPLSLHKVDTQSFDTNTETDIIQPIVFCR